MTDTLIGLDLGRNVGVCYGSEPDPPELKGWELPSTIGQMMTDFEGRLRGLIKRQDALIIAFERPFTQFDKPSANVRKHIATLNGQMCIILKICYEQYLFPVSYEVRSVRKRFAGRGNATPEQVHKAAMRYGFKPATDHEADAALIWLAALRDASDDTLEKETI